MPLQSVCQVLTGGEACLLTTRGRGLCESTTLPCRSTEYGFYRCILYEIDLIMDIQWAGTGECVSNVCALVECVCVECVCMRNAPLPSANISHLIRLASKLLQQSRRQGDGFFFLYFHVPEILFSPSKVPVFMQSIRPTPSLWECVVNRMNGRLSAS